MSIPAGTKFIGIAPDVDTVEKKSTQANSPSNVYTIEDIQDGSVPDTRTITINGDTKDLSADRSWTISTGITVGTTPVTSGTNGRVFFQAGGVVQQDANFTFDNTLKRLTLRAVGTGATDIPLVVRNSADTLNFLEIRGDNQFLFNNNSSGISSPFTIRSTDNNSAPYIRAISNGDISEASLIATRTGGSGVSATGLNRGFVQLSNVGGNLNVLSSNEGFAFSSQPVSAYNPTSDQMRLRNGNLSIGTGYTGTARLDVRAQGALSTDIAFRVRNSADTQTLMQLEGNGTLRFNDTSLGINYLLINQVGASNSSSCFIDNGAGPAIRFNHGIVQNGLNLTYNTTSRVSGVYISTTRAIGDATIFFDGGQNIRIGQGFSNMNQPDANATRTIQQMTGVAPTTSVADGFQQYSADITAGNAAPHFRTEVGDIIKLYKNTAVTTPQGIADALTNLGVLAASTIVPSVQSVVSATTVTPTAGNDLVIITAQAAALTLANPTGTWAEGQDLMIRIKDDGTARAITWDTNYRAIGVTLPTTTVINKTTYVGVIYNSTNGKWDVIGVTTEA